MIDGRGQVRITDFGLADLAEGIHGAEIRAGTPDYMAPEQFAGKEVTLQSDLYGLGLVLYELFTGERAYRAESMADLLRGLRRRPAALDRRVAARWTEPSRMGPGAGEQTGVRVAEMILLSAFVLVLVGGVLALASVLGIYGFYISMAGRPLFEDVLARG